MRTPAATCLYVLGPRRYSQAYPQRPSATRAAGASDGAPNKAPHMQEAKQLFPKGPSWLPSHSRRARGPGSLAQGCQYAKRAIAAPIWSTCACACTSSPPPVAALDHHHAPTTMAMPIAIAIAHRPPPPDMPGCGPRLATHAHPHVHAHAHAHGRSLVPVASQPHWARSPVSILCIAQARQPLGVVRASFASPSSLSHAQTGVCGLPVPVAPCSISSVTSPRPLSRPRTWWRLSLPAPHA